MLFENNLFPIIELEQGSQLHKLSGLLGIWGFNIVTPTFLERSNIILCSTMRRAFWNDVAKQAVWNWNCCPVVVNDVYYSIHLEEQNIYLNFITASNLLFNQTWYYTSSNHRIQRAECSKDQNTHKKYFLVIRNVMHKSIFWRERQRKWRRTLHHCTFL